MGSLVGEAKISGLRGHFSWASQILPGRTFQFLPASGRMKALEDKSLASLWEPSEVKWDGGWSRGQGLNLGCVCSLSASCFQYGAPTLNCSCCSMAQEPLFHPLQREKPLVVWLAMWSGEGNWAFRIRGPDFRLTL